MCGIGDRLVQMYADDMRLETRRKIEPSVARNSIQCPAELCLS